MIESVALKFTELDETLRIPAQGITIFVGPNNSGKSLVLREIENDISNHQNVTKKILEDFEIVWSDEGQIDEDIENLKKKNTFGASPDYIHVGRFNPDGSLDAQSVPLETLRAFMKSKTEKRWVTSQFLKYFLIRLDGRTKFDLTNDRPKGDLLGQAQNLLVHLFKDDDTRAKVNKIVYDSLAVYFTIEQLSANDLRIRLSATKPDENEQNWNRAARNFHSKAIHIKEASDGVQAFVGIVCAVLAGDYRAILIDEPEAFLHPPLARALGDQLTSNLQPGGSLLASTHSSDFLMGCLQASPNVRVVRLEYSNGKSKGKIVDSASLTKLFKAPLLRSANVISSLFHDGVIVTESDNDRAFYGEVYHRLPGQENGYPSLLFINAQNKQTIRDIIGPLRAFGVPAAAIVDIDILKDGGGDWTKWLEAARFPHAMRVGLGQQRASLLARFVDSELDMKKGGISNLKQDDRNAANEFFDQLAKYGLFVVRNGEVETWLSHLGITSKKTSWTMEMLERLGSDPADETYIEPEQGDVWDFIKCAVRWVREPDRKGTD